jgi:putative ABC transport system permease protein
MLSDLVTQLVSELRARWRVLVRRAAIERDLDDELRLHLDLEAAKLERAGLPRDEARRRARLAFGGIERIKEETRAASGTRVADELGQDVRYAVRQLRASRGFAAATILTIALGVGAITTMRGYRRYTTAQERTLRSPERLVALGQGRRECSRCVQMAAGNVLTLRSDARAFESISMFADWEPIVRGPDRTELLDGVRVSTEFFRTISIQPLLGRTLVPDDSAADRRHVVVLSERIWRLRFAADSAVLGRLVVLDRTPYTIVGIIPTTALYPRDADLWVPLVLAAGEAAERSRAAYRAIGRLRDGVTVQTAAAELAVIGGRLTAAHPASMRDAALFATPMLALNQPDGDPQTTIFIAAMWVVLAIACINLAGLLVARLATRRRELAVRSAMGAGPGRIVRQLLVETMLLTALGGSLGALGAVWGVAGLAGWPAVRAGAGLELESFAVALGIGLTCGLLIGLWPALRFARPTLVYELRDRNATGGVDAARGRRTLVCAEVALAIVLLSAAGLLARSYQHMYAFDPGFRGDRVLAVRVKLSDAVVPDDGRHVEQLVAAIAAVPGVERAGATLGLPFGHGWATGAFDVDGRPAATAEQRPRARLQATTPGYFAALGIPVMRGRSFMDADRAGAVPVAIVNQAAAERFFPGEDPIGRAVVIDSVRWQIVGVVGTVFTGNFDELAAPDIYRPLQQWERRLVWVAVRARGEPDALAPAVMAAVRAFDPDIAITRAMTMDALRAADMGSERKMLRLMGGFAVAALLICAIGLYGLISYSVSQRTRELGVRLALGATGAAVMRLVLGQGVRTAAIGGAVGIAGAAGVLRVMQSMLFRVSPADPITLAGVALGICVVALAAAYAPARRAMRVDPMTSLRHD